MGPKAKASAAKKAPPKKPAPKAKEASAPRAARKAPAPSPKKSSSGKPPPKPAPKPASATQTIPVPTTQTRSLTDGELNAVVAKAVTNAIATMEKVVENASTTQKIAEDVAAIVLQNSQKTLTDAMVKAERARKPFCCGHREATASNNHNSAKRQREEATVTGDQQKDSHQRFITVTPAQRQALLPQFEGTQADAVKAVNHLYLACHAAVTSLPSLNGYDCYRETLHALHQYVLTCIANHWDRAVDYVDDGGDREYRHSLRKVNAVVALFIAVSERATEGYIIAEEALDEINLKFKQMSAKESRKYACTTSYPDLLLQTARETVGHWTTLSDDDPPAAPTTNDETFGDFIDYWRLVPHRWESADDAKSYAEALYFSYQNKTCSGDSAWHIPMYLQYVRIKELLDDSDLSRQYERVVQKRSERITSTGDYLRAIATFIVCLRNPRRASDEVFRKVQGAYTELLAKSYSLMARDCIAKNSFVTKLIDVGMQE